MILDPEVDGGWEGDELDGGTEYDGDNALVRYVVLRTQDGFLAVTRGAAVLMAQDGVVFNQVCDHTAHDLVLINGKGRYWC